MLHAGPFMQVGDAKDTIRGNLDASLENRPLVFEGTVLEDSFTLESYGVVDGSLLYLPPPL